MLRQSLYSLQIQSTQPSCLLHSTARSRVAVPPLGLRVNFGYCTACTLLKPITIEIKNKLKMKLNLNYDSET